MKRLLMTSAFVAATALPIGFGTAYAQSAGDSASPQAPATTTAPAPDQVQSPLPTASSSSAAAQTPPPSDAIISAQGSGDLRADKMIGMKVYNPDGQEVGKVKDVLFDPNGNIKGVVLNVGGVLGIGAKPVGLQWKELDVQPSSNVVKVNYTKEQLEAAPSFQAAEASDASTGSVTNQPAQPLIPAAPSPSQSSQ